MLHYVLPSQLSTLDSQLNSTQLSSGCQTVSPPTQTIRPTDGLSNLGCGSCSYIFPAPFLGLLRLVGLVGLLLLLLLLHQS